MDRIMVQPPVIRLSAAAIGRRIAWGGVDAVEITEMFLERMAAAADSHVFIRTTAERALEQAKASAKRHREGRTLGPLDGVPVSWKDLIDIAGTPTTAGSALLREAEAAPADAAVVRNLEAAGMVSLGKVNLTEFAYSGLGLNPHFDTPTNPHDRTTPRAPGGSSSGSGVAVAMGLAPCSIGTDTGGSVRIPAAFNGVVGYKSSEGRIPKAGVFPLSDTLDTIGPLASSVEDCVLLDLAMRGALTSSVRRASVSDLELIVDEGPALDGAEDAVGANFEAVLERLSAAGARVTRRRLPLLEEVKAITREHGSLTAAEAYVVHRERVDGPQVAEIDRRVVARILGGKRMAAYDVLSIARGRERLKRQLSAELGGGLLAMPTTPITAPRIAPLEADDERFHAVNLKALSNTMIGNFLGACALAIPSGADRAGLPTSAMFHAPGGADERLLSFGLAIERVVGEA